MDSESSDASRFFVLEEGTHGSRYDVAVDTVEPINRADAPRCPRCGAFVGLLKWLPPHRVELKLHGEELGDFIKKSAYDLLLSERFVDAFRAEALTGLDDFHPVEVVQVRRMKKRPCQPLTIPSYSVASTCFGRAAVDLMLNRARTTKPITCLECRSTTINAIHGVILEPGTWQGEDIFRPRGLPGTLVVSERFKDFVERHRLTNIRLTPAEQYVKDPSNLGPAPLPTA